MRGMRCPFEIFSYLFSFSHIHIQNPFSQVPFMKLFSSGFRHQMFLLLAILFLDADHFKEINDSLGHEYGDLVLKKIANTLCARCPEDGYVFRFGGDEFILFCPRASEESVCMLREAFVSDFKAQEIEVSMGFVLTDFDENKQLDDYLSLADKDMYEEKGEHHRRH